MAAGRRGTRRPTEDRQFESFEASELWCPRCRASRPVRSRLLLVLPGGDEHEYRCVDCGTAVGTRRDQAAEPGGLVGPDGESPLS